MMDYKYLHEAETVELCSQAPRPVSELLVVFRSLGFTLYDDVVSLDRKGKVPRWQSRSIVEVEVCYNGDEVFGFDDGEWNSIRLKYLFASRPFALTDQFIETAFEVGRRLSVPVRHNGVSIDAEYLRAYFSRCRADLLAHTGQEPGAEDLVIFIYSTYPRR